MKPLIANTSLSRGAGVFCRALRCTLRLHLDQDGLDRREPLTWLSLRMATTICRLLVIVAITRPAWPKGSQIFHSVVAGLLVHGSIWRA